MYAKKAKNFELTKKIPIVYENTSFCIVNKPSGIPVQGGAGISVSLTDILTEQLQTAVFPVHRLDKQTSGLLIVAKTAEAARQCRQLFESQRVEKEYTALCFGACSTRTEHVIDSPVREHGTEKKAVSIYRCIAGVNDYSLVSIKLCTGRMHQIRIHLASIGHPILGDDKYGNFALNKLVWKEHCIKKLQLCASRLQLPFGGKKCTYSIPLPNHMTHAAKILLGDMCTDIK